MPLHDRFDSVCDGRQEKGQTPNVGERAARRPSLQAEQALWQAGKLRVVGVDEAGLGSLAGPVVAAACLLPAYCSMIDGVCDSKLLSRERREKLFEQIRQQAVSIGVGAASVREVERFNVRRASHLAMQRALGRVGAFDFALIDGREIAHFSPGGESCISHRCIIDGDALSYAISCASIIAKVTRDRLMCRLAKRYPVYGWERNAGYGTPEHLAALQQWGPSPHHRFSYRPVKGVLFSEPYEP